MYISEDQLILTMNSLAPPPLPTPSEWKTNFQSLHIYIFILIADVHIIDPLAGVAGNIEALHPSQEVVLGALAQSTLRKGGPDLAHVGATRQGGVSVQDGVTGLGEVGVTRLPIVGPLVSNFDEEEKGVDKMKDIALERKKGKKRERGGGFAYRAKPSTTSFIAR